MPLHPTSQFLVDAIHACPLLDGRFEAMQLVNFDSVADVRRGCLSLVFRARDTATGQDVALKFFDPPSAMNAYRLAAFRREHEILNSLLGVDRCLQVASGLRGYDLVIPTASGPSVTLPCEFFAVDWIDGDIEKYFFCQEKFGAAEKLRLFSSIATSVQVLHSREVFHRDLKPDNLRLMFENGRMIVVPIDLGTAAKVTSSTIQGVYADSAGAPAYGSPEARCGLAGNRKLARQTDLYALGCLLFELFNKDYFFKAMLARNHTYAVVMTVLGTQVNRTASESVQQREWDAAIAKHGNSFVPVPVNGAGSDVPPGIAPILNEILLSLTHVDYRRRPNLQWVQRKIASALMVLGNEKLYQARVVQAREVRRRRLERLAKRELRAAKLLK